MRDLVYTHTQTKYWYIHWYIHVHAHLWTVHGLYYEIRKVMFSLRRNCVDVMADRIARLWTRSRSSVFFFGIILVMFMNLPTWLNR